MDTSKQPKASSRIGFGRRKQQLEKDLEHITEQMYLRNKELADTNKILSLLSTVDNIAMEPYSSLNLVCNNIAKAIVKETEHALIGLFCRDIDNKKLQVLRGWSGAGITPNQKHIFNKPVTVSTYEPWLYDKIKNKKLLSTTKFDFTKIEGLNKLIEVASAKSICINKLYVRDQLVGILIIGYTSDIEELSETEEKLVNRLSESIGIALDNKLLFEENQVVLRKLKVSNNKLRELDETKDDFISMASHQLRTPLTSIKGYISMMLEGDAGKINHIQRDMLGQAFLSSQRMVYLISDMLNVSRLKTGKFAINNRPVNLAEIVEQEMEQLKETADAHSIDLTYEKPKDFPILAMDETKIRQVIMNFADNAIYYTPKGGHVQVVLTNDDATIELKVIDDGIGVPARERHHLFTKFYRAGNARKVRPDGTGLGLYMAKKVIVAQGGSLIFESGEGKGSTFGFIFTKAKLPLTEALPQPTKEEAKPELAHV